MLSYVDAGTERLIVERLSPTEGELETNEGTFVFALVTQTGDAHYIRAFRVENLQRGRTEYGEIRLLVVLRPSGRWQRIDRRRSERVELPDLQVEGVRKPATGGLLRFRGTLRDISEGGVLMMTDQRMLLQDIVEFDLPLQPSVRVRARVLRVQGGTAPQTWQAGCIFEGLTLDQSARIGDYVARLAAPPQDTDDVSDAPAPGPAASEESS